MSVASLLSAIDNLWLPAQSALRELRDVAERATEAQVVQLQILVLSIEKKQNDFLEKIVTVDPEFPQKLAGFLRTAMDSVRGDVEATDAAALSTIAAQLDES